MAKKHITVVGAVIISQGLVFCTRRGPGQLEGMWEFPGGKLEQGENDQQALIREIREELGCLVEVNQQITTTTYEYEFAVVTLTTYACRLIEGTPHLTEHTESRWLAPTDLESVTWAPADVPTVMMIAGQGPRAR